MSWRAAAMALGVAAAAVWFMLLPPIGQPQDYHRFADGRVFLGVENAGDTLSSLALFMVGALGVVFLWRERASGRAARFVALQEARPYWALFCAAGLAGFGSAYYHLAPDDARLAWDRLPMAAAFMSLLAAMIAERVSLTAGVRLLVPLIALGVASVLYWRLSALYGSEDLRPYVAVQFGSIAIILAVCALYPSRYTRGETPFVAAAVYGIAKFFELNDRQIYELGHWVSGHTLKHLTAAAALYLIVRWLRQRRPRDPAVSPPW